MQNNYKITSGDGEEIQFIITFLEGPLKNISIRIKNLDVDDKTDELIVDYTVPDSKFDLCNDNVEVIKETLIQIITDAAALAIWNAPANDE